MYFEVFVRPCVVLTEGAFYASFFFYSSCDSSNKAVTILVTTLKVKSV